MRVRTMLELVELMQPAAVELFGGDEDAQVAVGPDVVIDNRRATEGCLFVAIPESGSTGMPTPKPLCRPGQAESSACTAPTLPCPTSWRRIRSRP